ncbi:protein translocase subunit SecA-like [Xenentodon cancila]
MVSWCIMALSPTGRLIQVGTGEGKSCIVAMFAAFRAMTGQKVDIMSSSPVLAARDLDEWSKFYKHLKISADCNVNKRDEDLKKCYECQVVYGTVEEFAGSWLKHNFSRMDIFGQRTFQCAIVDEVDSLMLDKGHHVVYLGSDMPALQHLNPLLALIWATVNQYSEIGTDTTVGRKYPFHQVVLEQLKDKGLNQFTILQMAEDTGVLAKGSVREIKMNPSLLSEKTAGVGADKLAGFFKEIERRFPSCQFDLHKIKHNGELEDLNKRQQGENTQRRVLLLLMNGGFCQYMYPDVNSVLTAAEEEIKAALRFTPCELKDTKDCCYVPGFLSDLVTSKLKVWIRNAFQAQNMRMDHEYILEEHGIVPVDYSCTGVVENFMTWSDGLHQFLEMKHDRKMSDMTAVTNYMSSFGMLQKYEQQIYGMSGTLGQQAETETLQKIYQGIQTCQIPSFKRRKLFEVEGKVVEDEEKWIVTICDVVTEQTRPAPCRGKRAILLICETIKRAKTLQRALQHKVPGKLYINNNMDNSEIFATKLGEGEVIIATNLAGRGTDLQVSDAVKRAGGLFIVQTFLPKNSRVEAQAFGRTARQGSPGSAQLIICSSHLSEPLRIFLRKHEALLENMMGDMPSYQKLFVMQLRLYQQSNDDEETDQLSLILSLLLTKKSKSNSCMKTLKEVRDNKVTAELSHLLEVHIPKLRMKEDLFSHYLTKLDALYKNNNNKPASSDVTALNEFWGMWLLTKYNENDSVISLKNSLEEDLEKAIQKILQRKSPLSNLHHYTVYGSELQNMGKLPESINMYTTAIQEDHCWAAVAYYNRAFASLMQQNKNQNRNCISQALQDLQNALKALELCWDQFDLTYRWATQTSSDSVTRFDKHFVARQKVLVSFRANINEAIKIIVGAGHRGGYVDVKRNPVYFLTPLEHLLDMIFLSVESVRVIRSRDPLRSRQLISSPQFDILFELNRLASLGLTHCYVLESVSFFRGFFSKLAGTSR